MLDVREPEELAGGVIPGSINIPMNEVEHRLREIPNDREIVVICHIGERSAYVAKRLNALGYHRALSLSGGVDGWLRTMDAISPNDLSARAASLKLFDIRKDPDDRQIPGSVRAEGAALETGNELPFNKHDEVVLYCGSGNSCSRIAKTLRDRGYRAVALNGGFKAWVDAGLPTEAR
jgi:rhodanese-related sulfurtransferase